MSKKQDRSAFGVLLIFSVVTHGAALAWLAHSRPEVPLPEVAKSIDVVMSASSEPPPEMPEEPPESKEATPPEAERETPPEPPVELEIPREIEPPFESFLVLETDPADQSPELEAPAPEIETASIPAPIAPADPLAAATYEDLLVSLLRAAKEYPKVALRRGIEGDCALRLVLARSGSVLEASLATRSGHAILDEEVLRMVERARPFPAVPDEISGDRVEYVIPVVFRIE